METLIKIAIEGGWKDKYAFDNVGRILHNEEFDRILLDPLFFQALGKACGWAGRICFDCGGDMSCTKTEVEGLWTCLKCNSISGRIGWKHNAHTFYEINLTEGLDPAISYLVNLVKE